VLLDQKEIWTSPFHMHAADAKCWIGFGAVTAALIATDHQTSTIFENSKGQITWGNNISKIGASYTLLPLVAGFYGFGVLENDPKARETAVLGGEALLDSLIFVSVHHPPTRPRMAPASSYAGDSARNGDLRARACVGELICVVPRYRCSFVVQQPALPFQPACVAR